MSELRGIIDKYWEKVKEHRYWLHQHPEPSGQEKETSAYVAQVLRDMGLEPTEHVGGYGVTALIQGKGPGKCVGLRADMDALPLTESTGLACSSLNPGMAHSCGHDAHTAMLLGAAYVLNELKDTFPGAVKLVFQPSEENAASSGAKKMIEDGVLENPKVDAMFGQHVWPALPLGQVAVRDGQMMASSDRLFLTVKGKSSHGSAPENGIDAIMIAAYVVTALQSIVARNVSPLDSAVISFGNIHGGSAYNIITDEVKLEGTCRNLNPAIRDTMPQRIENIIKGVVEGMGGSYEFTYLRGYSPTVNTPDKAALVKEAIVDAVGQEGLLIPERPALGGEDFSFYCEKVPSAFFWLGCHDPAKPPIPIHHGAFAPAEESLPIGMEVMVGAALKFLRQ